MKITEIEKVKVPSTYFASVADELKNFIRPLRELFGVTHFGYQKLYPRRTISFLTTSPEFTEIFVKEKFYRIAFIDEHDKYEPGYHIEYGLPENKIMTTARETFNLAHHLVVVRPHKDFCEHFYFAAEKENYQINYHYINHRDVFERFIDYFKAEATGMLQGADQNRVIYPSDIRDSTILNDRNHQALKHKLSSFNAIIHQKPTDIKDLTFTENICAEYLREGLSAKEIARNLNISNRTVEKHIAKIKHKFNCPTTKKLLVRLLNQAT